MVGRDDFSEAATNLVRLYQCLAATAYFLATVLSSQSGARVRHRRN